MNILFSMLAWISIFLIWIDESSLKYYKSINLKILNKKKLRFFYWYQIIMLCLIWLKSLLIWKYHIYICIYNSVKFSLIIMKFNSNDDYNQLVQVKQVALPGGEALSWKWGITFNVLL